MRLKYLNSIKLKCQNSGFLFNYLGFYLKYFLTCCSSKTDSLLPVSSNGSSLTSSTSKQKSKTSSLRAKLRLFYLTFFYNESNDTFQVIETAAQPFVGCFGQCMRFLGIFLVMFIYAASTNMSCIFFTIILPEVWKTNFLNFLFHFLVGTTLVVNVFFHYTMGLITKPGDPPQSNVENIVSVCRKCLTSKPARTHHCSVCNRCILKMDHHCPWFNNCIGFYNHRYFFLFVAYFTLALYYLSIFGFHYYQLYAYPSMDFNVLSILVADMRTHSTLNDFPGQYFYYKLSTIEFFIAFVASFALTAFAGFNGWLISKGITNIEIKTIRIPCIKSTDSYVNPYDLGFVNNWKLFLGFDSFKTFFTRVIIPSAHKPLGDGVNWYGYINFGILKDKHTSKIIEV